MSDFLCQIDIQNQTVTVYLPTSVGGKGKYEWNLFWGPKRPLRSFQAILDFYFYFILSFIGLIFCHIVSENQAITVDQPMAVEGGNISKIRFGVLEDC